ncbi:phosphonopyruvate decarboxylase [Paenibacillus sp. FSL H8-0537]|uniref:phosphonopyruvate decarboxylase n=1 Tax=Paenibacillus sp. FSL H8-0537 TaxID=2921399 RepID=UPI0031011500
MDTKNFGQYLKQKGFDFFTGVPCSFLDSLINYAINDCEYIAAANEGDAVAIASGAYLAGKKPVVLMQNSGLTNAVSPLTSLNYTFRLPVLGFVSLRGQEGIADEPQHELMGKITTDLLDLMNVKWAYLSDSESEYAEQIDAANQILESNQSFFFVVKQATLSKEELIVTDSKFDKPYNKYIKNKTEEDELPRRFDALTVINKYKNDSTIQLATTGKTGRELYDLEDSSNNLYMVGSMGCVSSLGLGAALNTSKKVVVIDGDGSVLMRMGSMATIGYYRPNNMLHILLDNNCHDSTGGQFTVSGNIDFTTVANACGYVHSYYIHNLSELEAGIQKWQESPELTFLYVRIAEGSKKELGRPVIKPFEVKERLQAFLTRTE